MSAHKKNAFRPTLETLEDRCLPSTSPWAVLTQAQQQQTLMQNHNMMLGDAAMVLQQAQTTTGALMSQRFAELQAAKWIRIEVPKGWFEGNGLRVNISNTNLGSVLDSIPTKDFYVSRDENHRTAQGYWVKFEYQYTKGANAGPWTAIHNWSTSGQDNNEKINVPNGWHPNEIDPSKNQEFKLNIRVTLMDPKGNPVPGEQYQTGAFSVQFFGAPKTAGELGNGGQTQTARDQFFATLAQTASQTNNPNGSMSSAQAGRTGFDGHESVDAFLMQARMNDLARMSAMGSSNSSPFQPATNGMAQHFGF